MRLLLDTHALLWWLDGDRRLSPKARLGKLPGATDVASDVAACVAGQGFLSIDITLLHAQRAGHLPTEHRDPFDRMLIAQSQMEDGALVSDDDAFDSFDVRRFW